MIRQSVFCQFVNEFSALLLYKIIFFAIFDTVDVLKIFVISRSTEILMKWNFWPRLYWVKHHSFRLCYQLCQVSQKQRLLYFNNLPVLCEQWKFLEQGNSYYWCMSLPLSTPFLLLQGRKINSVLSRFFSDLESTPLIIW